MRKLFFAISILLSSTSHADALSDLRLRLQGAKPTGPVSAKIELRSNMINEEDGHQDKIERLALLDATHDSDGIRLNWSSAFLDKTILHKANAYRNPDAQQIGLLAALDADAAVELLDSAQSLLLLLEGATLVESKADMYENKPATVITVKPRLSMATKDKKRLKKSDYTARLWLDAEGWPLAIESQQYLKFSWMLFSFVTETKEKRSYAQSTGRLLVTASSRDIQSEGAVGKSQEHTVTTVTVLRQSGCQSGCR